MRFARRAARIVVALRVVALRTESIGKLPG